MVGAGHPGKFREIFAKKWANNFLVINFWMLHPDFGDLTRRWRSCEKSWKGHEQGLSDGAASGL